jgi:hypothetical protein
VTSFRDFIVKWIVCDDQPFVVIEGDHLRHLFRLLNPSVKIPGADTIHNDILKSFKEESTRIQEILQVFIFIYFYLIILINIKILIKSYY